MRYKEERKVPNELSCHSSTVHCSPRITGYSSAAAGLMEIRGVNGTSGIFKAYPQS